MGMCWETVHAKYVEPKQILLLYITPELHKTKVTLKNPALEVMSQEEGRPYLAPTFYTLSRPQFEKQQHRSELEE